MGRRKSGKKCRSMTKKGNVKLPPHIRNELTEIVDELYKRCCFKSNIALQVQPNLTPGEEWEEFIEIYKLLEKICTIENDIVLPVYDRQEQIAAFEEWLKSNNCLFEGVEIHDYAGEGFGLKCTKDLMEGDLVFKIPKPVIMCEESARKSYLGTLIEDDPILKHMVNVTLSLHLLGEYVNPDSFWGPYLRLLPSEFNTVLYLTPQQIQMLKGSPVMEEVVKQFRNVSRQYSYFYRVLREIPEAKSWPIRDFYTFNAYRWAVTVVMTRLNNIPSKHNSGSLALIPALDMANHEHGKFSTAFSEETDEIFCYAQRDFRISEEFLIYYGHRSNMEFFQHNGFVYRDNPNDSLTLKLGVSKSDTLYESKKELLSTFGIPPNGSFVLVPGMHPIAPELLVFARVFSMDKESLDKWLISSDAKNLMLEDCDVGGDVADKALKFLKTRVLLLTKAYATSLEEDESSLPSLSGPEVLIRKMLIEEKKILRDATLYLSTKMA